jgi:toxin ParE1/3/4
VRLVLWSSDALTDLERQVDYIHDSDLDAAKRVGERLIGACDKLGDSLTGRPGRVSGAYEKSVTGAPYIIAYAVDRARGVDEAVIILRIIHSGKDWRPDSWPT